jgi:NADPH:quinone reductase-like Zn-dependent oxidoreductase
VLVRILAAPITPVDFALLSSSASASNGKAGTEGVGIVEAVGPDVKGITAGSYVVASKAGAGM